MTHTVTILGCGSSGGVPRVASGWGRCNPENPKNRRRRCSILLERSGLAGSTTVLIDTSPDLREQLIEAEVDHIDGVFYTHEHADHTHGIDDLRPLVLEMQRRIQIFGSQVTLALLHHRFSYCFASPPGSSYPPILDSHQITAGEIVSIGGLGGSIGITPFRVVHGDIDSFGFRIGNFAYAPDVSAIPEESLKELSGLDVLVLDALRYIPHPTHLTVQESLNYIAAIAPKRAILTNLHTDLDFEELRKLMPDNVEPAYDGMKISFS